MNLPESDRVKVRRAATLQIALFVGSLLWGVTALILGSDAGVGLFPGVFGFLSGVALASFTFLIPLVTCGVTRRPPSLRNSVIAVGTICWLAATGYFWMSGTAFRYRLEMSAPALTAYVQALPAEIDREVDENVGLFKVSEKRKRQTSSTSTRPMSGSWTWLDWRTVLEANLRRTGKPIFRARTRLVAYVRKLLGEGVRCGQIVLISIQQRIGYA